MSAISGSSFRLSFFAAALAVIGSNALGFELIRHQSISNAKCALPPGWQEVASLKRRYIVFGEVHGTREGPDFIGGLACGLASAGQKVLVAIEHDATNNAALQKAWMLPEKAFAAKLRSLGWAGRIDGVASGAMFALIERLHRMSVQGHKIHVVAFNGFRDDEQRRRFSTLPAQGPHEAAQAENIHSAAKNGDYDFVIVLVGNLHARKTPVEQDGVYFRPMAMRLGSAEDVVSLNMTHSGGTMWNCLLNPNVKPDRDKPLAPDAMDCRNHTTRGWPTDLGRHPFIRLGSFPGDPAAPSFDGFYWLGPVSGSVPAVSNR